MGRGSASHPARLILHSWLSVGSHCTCFLSSARSPASPHPALFSTASSSVLSCVCNAPWRENIGHRGRARKYRKLRIQRVYGAARSHTARSTWLQGTTRRLSRSGLRRRSVRRVATAAAATGTGTEAHVLCAAMNGFCFESLSVSRPF